MITNTYRVKGMHCASCVLIIEKSLKNTEGVSEANVNLVTEKATIVYDSDKATDDKLISAVANVGYKAFIKEEFRSEDQECVEKQKELNDLRTRVIVSLGLGFLVLWGSFPALMDTAPSILKNFWIQLILATPVQFWAGWIFYRATIPALKHRTANMDTLVVIGTTVAYGYSVFVTMFPQIVENIGVEPMPYFDVATIIIGLILNKNRQTILHSLAMVTYLVAFIFVIQHWSSHPISLFGGMLRLDDFSSFFNYFFSMFNIINNTFFN